MHAWTEEEVNHITWIEEAFRRHCPMTLPCPYIFGTEEPSIYVEWSTAHNMPSLEINLNSKSARWHDFDLDDENDETNAVFDLNNEDNWKWITNRIRNLSRIDG